jgi:transposase
LFVDNLSSHTVRLVRDWLAIQERLQMYYLPKCCFHLNPVEQIWIQPKGKVATNRLHGSLQTLLDMVDAFFAETSPQCALAWATVT